MGFLNMGVEPSKMSTRGQIVIPRGIREKMSLEKDALFMVGVLDEETIVMKKVDKAKIAADFMKFRKNFIIRAGGLTPGEVEAEIDAVRKKRLR
jgi:bifunctional DNA-binding transcriptional regulator/antitoxin component of YhaV-PrlF toxin-antitoxin module